MMTLAAEAAVVQASPLSALAPWPAVGAEAVQASPLPVSARQGEVTAAGPPV
jgi:hypothetical protein